MIFYFLEFSLCSACLLGCYFLLFRNQKLHQFNRCYLLFSLGFSLIIPKINFEFVPEPEPKREVLEFVEKSYVDFQEFKNNTVNAVELSPQLSQNQAIFWQFYCGLSALLFVRFLINLIRLWRKIKFNKCIKSNDYCLVLLPEESPTHSFLHYIFVSEKTHKMGLNQQILRHELCHVQQKHTWDILLLETLQIIFWLNPILWFYGREIRLNHEFLADDAALFGTQNVAEYQLLLVTAISQNGIFQLSSQFNFSITKQRFNMMTKHTPTTHGWFRKLAFLPILALMFYLFSEDGYAQAKNIEVDVVLTGKQKLTDAYVKKFLHTMDEMNVSKFKISDGETKIEVSKNEGVSQAIFNEFVNVVKKGIIKGEERSIKINITSEGLQRLDYIYRHLSEEQLKKIPVIPSFLFPFSPPPKKQSPTQAQIKSWQNSKIYGVWLDGKHIKNQELNKYKPADFAHFFVSKLYGKAKQNASYDYQINIDTKEGYERAWGKNSFLISRDDIDLKKKIKYYTNQ